MFSVNVFSASPAGVEVNTTRDYYEVSDALTVAEIEFRNALTPIGRMIVASYDRLSYEVEGAYGERIVVTVRNDQGECITLRDPQGLPFYHPSIIKES